MGTWKPPSEMPPDMAMTRLRNLSLAISRISNPLKPSEIESLRLDARLASDHLDHLLVQKSGGAVTIDPAKVD